MISGPEKGFPLFWRYDNEGVGKKEVFYFQKITDPKWPQEMKADGPV